ncbi:hydrogenase nickel incorporation protein HypB [Halovenus sp. HT40]|uniref:hydrogenase nickel incorporation protein HypB n=1 Tax=Halovenus sp. HT40 TaxID=3126691 RepID=UPI00300F3733
MYQTHRFDRSLDRLLTDLLGPLSAHRFGHDHGHDDGERTDEDDVLARLREQAEEVHETVVHDHGISCIEFLGSTGSGKTTIVERLAERAPPEEIVGAIVGDVAGDDDARRLEALGVEVANVNTGKECHLDGSLVADAVTEFDLDALDRLYVENVGNMVCPADFPLGAQARVLVVSTTEGDDVVRKHPLLFQACDAAVVNKADIAEAVGADIERMRSDIEEIAPGMEVFETNARDGDGIDELAAYLGESAHSHTGHRYIH